MTETSHVPSNVGTDAGTRGISHAKRALANLSDAEVAVILDWMDFAIPNFADALLDWADGTPEGIEVRARLAATKALQAKLAPSE